MSTDLYLEQLAIAVREGNESGIRVYYDLLRAAEETKRPDVWQSSRFLDCMAYKNAPIVALPKNMKAIIEQTINYDRTVVANLNLQ